MWAPVKGEEAGTRVSFPQQSKGAEEGRDGSSLHSGLPGEEEAHPARPLRQSPVPTCLGLPLGVAALPSEFSPVAPCPPTPISTVMRRTLEKLSPILPQLSCLSPSFPS